jgi:hypothetical protein
VLSAVSKVPVTNLPDPNATKAAGGSGGGAARPEDELRWDWSSAGVAI